MWIRTHTNADGANIPLKFRQKVYPEEAQSFIVQNVADTQFNGPRLTKTKVELEA